MVGDSEDGNYSDSSLADTVPYVGESDSHQQDSSSDMDEPVTGSITTTYYSDSDSSEQYYNDTPCLHSYLGAGSELDTVRGRTVLEENAIVTMELYQSSGIMLMPGQTLPLTVFDSPNISMFRSCLESDRTFGVLASWTDGQNTTVNNIGTTVEIYEFRYRPDQDTSGFRVKAKGRQRFKLLESDRDSERKVKVRILPEVVLPDPLDSVKLQCLHRHRTSAKERYRARRWDAAVTHWPAFVYEQYSIRRLVSGVKKELDTLIGPHETHSEGTKFKTIVPDDPTELSFWVAQNIPMKEEHRLLMLKLNSPIQRLRWELQTLQQCRHVLCCKYCSSILGSSADIFSMSVEGPQSTYVNPGGYVHETITLYKVRNVFSLGPPSTNCTWFPGYGWAICKCKHCTQHIGWKYLATSSKLKPTTFWGICRSSITVKILSIEGIEEEEQPSLVF